MIDVTITGSGRWNYLASTVKTFNRLVHCSEGFRFFVSDDAGYDLESDPARKMIPKIGWFHEWFFPRAQDYGECVKWLWTRVESDLFFHLQDDWVFKEKMDLDPLIALMRKNKDINQIRFNKRTIQSRLKQERGGPKGGYLKTNVAIDGIKLVATPYWAMHPSLCRTAFVRSKRLTFSEMSGNWKPNKWERYWLEEVFKDVNRANLADYRKKVGTYYYGQIGDPVRILHIGSERALTKRHTPRVQDERGRWVAKEIADE